MSLTVETRTIDDLEFTTQKLPARRAFALQNKLLKLIAPVLGSLSAGAAATGLASMDYANLALPLSAMFDKLDSTEADKLLTEVLGLTTVMLNGHVVALNKGDAIDVVFTGRLMTMYKAAAFALEWNFQDFFDAAKAAIAKSQAAAEAAKVKALPST